MKKKNEQEKDVNDINPYEVDKASKIPSWIIIAVLKYWAAAAAVFFIAIGGTEIGLILFTEDQTDSLQILTNNIKLIVLIGLFLAIVMNYVVKHIVILMNNRRNNTFRFNLINLKGFSAFLIHLLYCMIMSLVLFFVVSLFSSWHLIPDPFGLAGNQGIEPFSYGLFFLVLDSICVMIKNLIVMIVQRIIYKKQINDNTPIVIG